jgi:hypothetical protein
MHRGHTVVWYACGAALAVPDAWALPLSLVMRCAVSCDTHSLTHSERAYQCDSSDRLAQTVFVGWMVGWLDGWMMVGDGRTAPKPAYLAALTLHKHLRGALYRGRVRVTTLLSG